jgi:hypothetical protein
MLNAVKSRLLSGRNSFKLFLTFLILGIAIGKAYSQDNMMPPKPVDNKVYDAMVGNWSGESDMMGMKMTEDLKIYWTLNHQFIIAELKAQAKDNANMTYSGMGVYGVDNSGNAKMWWFDDWGADAMATGTGTFSDMKLSSKSSNPMYTDERTFELKDGNMVSNWTSTMMGKDGKEIKMNGTTVYKKK